MPLVTVLLAWGLDASAIGLGEIRTRSSLGERLVAEVAVFDSSRETLHSACFRLRWPAGDSDLPWLRHGRVSLRRGPPATLEISSAQPLRDPILQVGIGVACGYELSRDYTLLLSPREMGAEPSSAAAPSSPPRAPKFEPLRPQREVSLAESVRFSPPLSRAMSRPASRHPAARADRLVLGGGGEGRNALLLRLSSNLNAAQDPPTASGEAQREILRLEFRLLSELNRQASSQLALAEKLRNIEATLGELDRRVSDFAHRIEKGGEGAAPSRQPPPAPAEKPAAAAARPNGLSEWNFYALLIGAALGMGGWLGWRQYRQGSEPPMGGGALPPLADFQPPAPAV